MAVEIEVVNRLTHRWVQEFRRDENTVICGPGAWAILAVLLAGAVGDAETELSAVVGLDRENAASGFNDLASVLNGLDGLWLAAGLWARRDLEVFDSYSSQFSGLRVGEMPDDPAVLDRWASDSTNSMISTFPVPVTPFTALVVATAVATEAEWKARFEEVAGRTWNGTSHRYTRLVRSSTALDDVAIVEGATTISRAVCSTTSDLEFQLVAGDPLDAPADVLTTAVDAIHGRGRITPATELELGAEGGCLTVVEAKRHEWGPEVVLGVPAFEISAEHDLLENQDLFGLATASDHRGSHFPHIADAPLAVAAAGQGAMCAFAARGFRAAAVTAVATRLTGAAPPLGPHKTIVVEHDRPFGFLVVDRRSRLVVFAGWVNDIEPSTDAPPVLSSRRWLRRRTPSRRPGLATSDASRSADDLLRQLRSGRGKTP